MNLTNGTTMIEGPVPSVSGLKSQSDGAKLLKVRQPGVSDLMRSKMSRFSLDTLST